MKASWEYKLLLIFKYATYLQVANALPLHSAQITKLDKNTSNCELVQHTEYCFQQKQSWMFKQRNCSFYSVDKYTKTEYEWKWPNYL